MSFTGMLWCGILFFLIETEQIKLILHSYLCGVLKVFENHRCQIHQPGSQVYLDSDKVGVSHIQTVCHKRWWFSRWYPKSCRVSGWLLQTPPSAYPSNSSVTLLLESQKQLRTDVQMLCNVTFSSFIGDELVLSIWEKVRKGYIKQHPG